MYTVYLTRVKFPIGATFLIFLGVASTGWAQEKIRSTTLFLEGGGPAGFYSMNLDQIVFDREYIKAAARIGYSYSSGSLLPLGFSLLTGKEGNYFELGVGYSLYWPQTETVDTSNFFSARIGYRYQNPEGGFFMNLGPMYLNGGTLGNSPPLSNRIWFGVGLGYTLHGH